MTPVRAVHGPPSGGEQSGPDGALDATAAIPGLGAAPPRVYRVQQAAGGEATSSWKLIPQLTASITASWRVQIIFLGVSLFLHRLYL